MEQPGAPTPAQPARETAAQDRQDANRSRDSRDGGGRGRGGPRRQGAAPRPDAAEGGPREARGRRSRPGPRIALVDGSNVAHAGEGHSARLRNILLVRDKLIAEGYTPVIVVDAALRHQIDDAAGYERLVEGGEVKQAPAGTDADYFILAFARELGAAVVSNDQFRDRSRQFVAVRRQAIRFMIVADEVVFEKRTSRRRAS